MCSIFLMIFERLVCLFVCLEVLFEWWRSTVTNFFFYTLVPEVSLETHTRTHTHTHKQRTCGKDDVHPHVFLPYENSGTPLPLPVRTTPFLRNTVTVKYHHCPAKAEQRVAGSECGKTDRPLLQSRAQFVHLGTNLT
jgi:hypothetical protein